MKQGFVKYIYTFLIGLSTQILISQKNIQDLRQISVKQFNEGNYAEALNSSIEALKIAEKNKDCSQIVLITLQVGKVQYYLTNKPLALKTFYHAKVLVDSCGIDSLKPKVLYNLGALCSELDMLDSSIIFLNETVVILNKTKNYTELSRIHSVLADFYALRKKDLIEAEKHVLQAEKFAALGGNLKWIAFATTKRAILNSSKKNYLEALKYWKLALSYSQQMGHIDGRLSCLRSIGEVLAIMGKPEANKAYADYINLKDSVFRAETAGKIANYETLYKTEKKENENKALQQENVLQQSKIESRNKTIIGLLAGVLIIVIVLLWRISVVNLKKKQRELEATQALQKEKERISRDLHDNVGGQLSYVLYSIDGVNIEDKEKRAAVISDINQSVRSVISNLRETIWAINDEAISVNDFSDKLKVYVRSMFRNTETKIAFNEKIENSIQLNSFVGLNLYRICQEIINNAFKHAQANELSITIAADKKITIVISDNGIGFELNENREVSFGLANIKGRADETKISLELKTKPGAGTTYLLIV